ncbi:hypothetical protein TorRG33x02_045550 [Trema orientale]|uniref:Uncharacterized protein n=1 Tax=Trema orientale TaxID=63057 RepID=A0A2P5FPW9_TREOI|nr:hypothetical protein TorRG33x02_045550 [Trema orientale]
MSQVVETLKQIMQVSEDANSSDRSLQSSDNDQIDSELKPSQLGPMADRKLPQYEPKSIGVDTLLQRKADASMNLEHQISEMVVSSAMY